MVKGKIITKEEFLEHIAKETARMSSPGSFYGRVLRDKKTKEKVTNFFIEIFPIKGLWNHKLQSRNYKNWHKRRISDLGTIINGHIKPLPKKSPKTSFSIAAKLLDTFMYQLMKYERFRYLYKALYLPLDRGALSQLSRKTIKGVEVPKKLNSIATHYWDNPYSIPLKQYMNIQKELIELLIELLKRFNNNLPKDCRLRARIELNCILWPK